MTTTTNDPRAYLEGVLAKADAATEGPWERGEGSSYYVVEHEDFGTIAETYCTNDAEDAAFIASSRTAVPALARALLAVLAKIDDWEQFAGPESEAWRVMGPQKVSVSFAVDTIRTIITTELAKEVTK